MAEGQKIWFVYLSDHHEGPFTAQEIAEKAAQGLVTSKSLVWKDGMPEWVTVETIPEIQAVLNAPAAPAPAAAPIAQAAEPPSDGGLTLDLGSPAPESSEPSLAQMLAQSQSSSPAPAESLDSGASLSLDVVETSPAPEAASAPAPASAPIASAPIQSVQEPGEHEQVWTMRSGSSVSGLFSMQTLKEMAGQGQVPADAQFWYPGISDFVPLASFPALQALRKEKKPAANTGSITRPRGIAPITAAADVGKDEDTSPAIEAPRKPGFLEKFKNFFNKKKKSAASPVKNQTATTLVTKKAASPIKRKTGSSILRPLLIVGSLVLVVGAGAGVYLMFFSSPIPNMEDVNQADLEKMRAVVKSSKTAGGKFILVRAVGDDITPTYYVATNLPEGTQVHIELEGVSGTLVNAIQMKKSFSGTVDKRQLAVFPGMSDEGKPLPMGDYQASVTAEGAEPLKEAIFIGAPKKNHIYEHRMSQYKEKLQAAYDKEMQELKEYISTMHSLFGDLTAKITRNMTMGVSAAQRSALMMEWQKYLNQSFLPMMTQMQQKLKEMQDQPQYAERIYQDQPKQLSNILSEMVQLADVETKRLQSGAASSSQLGTNIKTELDGIEKWFAEAIMKAPLDVLVERSKHPVAATASTAAPAADVSKQ